MVEKEGMDKILQENANKRKQAWSFLYQIKQNLQP